ncbi:alpha/beta fold hydrolase [Vreelandella aquamarina]|uniref:alpha/beta fold hydrolase n=1 Tax=Vreelandella aquamarina TaxID=77097 RepID=UPI001CC4A529|nr:alpha/beta fold hydrolase [Halomonas aquamarina]
MSQNAYADYLPILPAALAEALDESVAPRLLVDGLGPLAVVGQARHGRLLWAHGAGAGHQSAFMQRIIKALAEHGIQVLAIDFPYMQQMQEQGKRRPPPRVERTLEHFAAWYHALEPLGTLPLWVGGKSMGGRIATLLASALHRGAIAGPGCPGVIVAGYPFHPPKAPEKLRLGHWPDIRCPLLVLQGERDPFGTREEVEGYTLPQHTRLAWLADGDHDFKPRRVSGLKHEFLIDEAAQLAASFVRAHGTPSGM